MAVDDTGQPPFDGVIETDLPVRLQLEQHGRHEGLGDDGDAVAVLGAARLPGLQVSDARSAVPDPVLVHRLARHSGYADLDGGVHGLLGRPVVVPLRDEGGGRSSSGVRHGGRCERRCRHGCCRHRACQTEPHRAGCHVPSLPLLAIEGRDPDGVREGCPPTGRLSGFQPFLVRLAGPTFGRRERGEVPPSFGQAGRQAGRQATINCPPAMTAPSSRIRVASRECGLTATRDKSGLRSERGVQGGVPHVLGRHRRQERLWRAPLFHSVATTPGHTTWTRTGVSASSPARVRVKPKVAAFAAT
jgi:hypothetical protein